MLIRFVAQNVYSFSESTEFNMLPRPKIRQPEGHKYVLPDIDLLKLAAVYGPNAAGKSNLVKALALIQGLATGKVNSHKVYGQRFKFDASKPVRQVLAVEFIENNTPYYYALEIVDGIIVVEELYRSGLGKAKDVLLFERKEEASPRLTFSPEFEQEPKGQLLKTILLEEFWDNSKTIFQWIAKRDNPHLKAVKTAMRWFESTLRIIAPNAKPVALALRLESDRSLNTFTHRMLRAYNLGISKIEVEHKPVEEIIGLENEEALSVIKERFAEEQNGVLTMRSADGDEVIVVRDNGRLVGKRVKVTQSEKSGREAEFGLNELSDGTIRLLDFMPAFQDVLSKPKVYVVDELERSMHPILAKELVAKFSRDKDAKGQLIFTTHESNLLDQDIFRQDEIWFAEKRPCGSTDLYALSDFKEHRTIDIRKGYLNGRYGAIPFLSNFNELNWHIHDFD